MNQVTKYAALACAFYFTFIIAGCKENNRAASQENPPLVQPPGIGQESTLVPPPTPPGLTPGGDKNILLPRNNQPPVFPPVPAMLPKPRILGPVTPAVVEVRFMAEPQIRVRLTDESVNPPSIARGKYRGKIDVLQLQNQKYVAVNTLPIDQYLAGVLAKEMYGNWSQTAFRTQAIVARTYALYQIMTQGRGQLWDVSDTVSSQVYGGIAGETAKARNAVAATRGEVLVTTSQGKTGIFCTYFSACSGGASQDAAEAWGDLPVGTLRAQRLGTIDSACPYYTWPTIRIAKSDLTRCINSWGVRNQLPYIAALGPVQNIQITKRSAATGRPTIISVTDAQGHTIPMRAEEFRIAILNDPTGTTPKPKSSWFEIQDQGSAVALTNGRGFGHGVGLSQWGTQALSLKGSTPTEILNLYYPGAKTTRLWK